MSDANGSLLWKLLPELEGQEYTVWDPHVGGEIEQRLRSGLRRDGLAALIGESDVVALLVAHPEVVELDWKPVLSELAGRGAVVLDFADFFSRRVEGADDGGRVVHAFGNTLECSVCGIGGLLGADPTWAPPPPWSGRSVAGCATADPTKPTAWTSRRDR